jgi:hypothetical protein
VDTISWPAATNGSVTLVNSPSRTKTFEPAGNACATSETNCEAVAPHATDVAGTPTRRPNAARDVSTASLNVDEVSWPRRHRSCAAETASATCRGGTPMDAVFR